MENQSHSWTFFEIVLQEYNEFTKPRQKAQKHWKQMCEYALDLYQESAIYKRRKQKELKNNTSL